MIGKALAGERQDMSTAIIRISYALDEAARLQAGQAGETSVIGLMSRILSEGGLIGPFVLRQPV